MTRLQWMLVLALPALALLPAAAGSPPQKAEDGFTSLRPEGSRGIANARGHIGLLGHGTRVEFRNLRIKEL
ncbi:MAG: hypothetical protein ACRD15_04555 [Vicinamibacterales bacterium]